MQNFAYHAYDYDGKICGAAGQLYYLALANGFLVRRGLAEVRTNSAFV